MRKNFFSNPAWIERYNYPYKTHDEIPQSVFDEINERLDKVISQEPLVTVAISAWNEEADILKTVSSIASSKTQYPFEIIVVNNNSTDKTQQTLDKLHIRSCFQPIQGWGPGRQMGMENAKGKYILTGDSDCIYADCWVEKMTTALLTEGTISAYGRYSFISEKGFARWQLTILEIFKDLIAEVRHVKRPFLNSYGMSMGYVREYGLKEGFYMNKTHGEDGRMAYDLMKYGKIRQVRSYDNRVWTGVRTLKKSGTFSQVLFKRIKKELGRFSIYFNTKMKYHPSKSQQQDQ